MKKLVSVITPTYGDLPVLQVRCIPSIVNQTYSPIEHLIVHDGPSRVEDHKQRDDRGNRRRFVSLGRNWHNFTPQKSWGSMARLVASGLAAGDYIAYLDHDDEFLPNHVEDLVNLLEQRCADWVYSQMKIVRPRVPEEVIGDGNPRWRHVSTQMVLHARLEE